MLVCPKCHHQQDSGKFCSVCGESISPAVTNDQQSNQSMQQKEKDIAQEQTAASVTAQPTVSDIKSGLSNYWSYFLRLVKNPTYGFISNEKHFVNGFITFGLYAIIYSLSIYFLTNSITRSFGSYMDSVPFFPVISRLTFAVIISFVITFGSAFVMTKLAKNQDSFKSLIAQYGSVLVPFTALNFIAMLGGIIGAIQLTLIALFISVTFTFIFVPVLFVYEKASNVNPQGQKIYLSLATIVLIVFISLLLADAIFLNIIEGIEELFYYF